MKTKAVWTLVGLAFLMLAVSVVYALSLWPSHAVTSLRQQVAEDAANQYWIAKKNGGGMDAYVHAQLAQEAYLQAADEINYRKWRDIVLTEANGGKPPRKPGDTSDT